MFIIAAATPVVIVLRGQGNAIALRSFALNTENTEVTQSSTEKIVDAAFGRGFRVEATATTPREAL